jgi:hypothetical protein
MRFNATVKQNGKLHIHNRVEFDRHVESFRRDDKEVKVTIEVKKFKSTRSLMQNAYYHGVVVAMVNDRLRDLGHEIDRQLTHEFLKNRFLYELLVDETTAELIRVPKSTTQLSKTDFMAYLEEIKRFAAETLDIYIPDPNEQISFL